jgi:hypothetical protein
MRKLGATTILSQYLGEMHEFSEKLKLSYQLKARSA